MQPFWESIAYHLLLPARFRLSQARTGTGEKRAIDIPFRKTGNARIFSVLFDFDLRRNCHHIDTGRFSGHLPNIRAGPPIYLFADTPPQTAQLVSLGSPQSSSLSPGGLNPPYQIGGHHSVQLGLKLMFSTSRTGTPDIGVPGAEYIADGRPLGSDPS
jgi:hypothetical protein